MSPSTPAEKTIQSTQTAFDIIETIANHGQATITEIASEVQYSRSTVHYHIKTLQQNRYVIKDEEGFRLGLRTARLGNLALQNHRLSGLVEKPAENLSTELGASAHVAVREGNQLVWLYRESPEDVSGLQTNVGTGTDMHCTAYGQAILAYSPPEVVDRIVEEYGLPGVTDETITERDALDDRLATIRDLGFAYSAEEYQEEVSSVAAPIINEANDTAVGAIGITDSHDRINDPYKHTKARRFSDKLPGLVQQAARIASDNLAET